MTQILIEDRLRELIEQRKWSDLRQEVEDIPAPDLADLLKTLKKPDRVLVFTVLPRQLASEVFADLETSDKDELLKDLTDEETRRLLADLPPDERTILLENLPGQATQRVLNLLSPADLEESRLLLGFPDESIGRLMRPDYVAVRPEWTIERALEHIRARGKDIETISIIYVSDSAWHLLDALELQRFILADPKKKVADIMDETYVSLNALDDREQAVHTMARYDLYALPVVDRDNILLGIVTVDDVLDVAEAEATEDFHKAAAVSPLKESYRETSILALYRKRIGWLIALIGVNLVSSGVIAAFEETLAATLALAFFIPLLIDTGGNTGAQSATLMIRALATDDLHLDEWFSTLIKEFGEGILLAITMAVAAFFLGYWRGGLPVAIVVSTTMLALVILANLVGMALPFLLTRFGMDPAVASSPLITTVVDALGLLIYFSLATMVLGT
jgi:magnesium transporter